MKSILDNSKLLTGAKTGSKEISVGRVPTQSSIVKTAGLFKGKLPQR